MHLFSFHVPHTLYVLVVKCKLQPTVAGAEAADLRVRVLVAFHPRGTAVIGSCLRVEATIIKGEPASETNTYVGGV